MKQPLAKVSIDGNLLSTFQSIRLEQTINDHHQFEIIVDQDVIEEFQSHTIDKSRKWLGKSIIIAFDEHEFLGVITNVQLSQSGGHYGNLILTGYSPTVRLEGGKHMQSWLDKDLKKIVKEVVGVAGIPSDIKPKYTTPYEYQAQYQESHFQFIQRLAHQHSEWLYYDGTKLIFGKPNPTSTIELNYGIEIEDINISINAVPSKQSIFSYHPLDDKRHNSASKDVVGGLSELGEFAFNTSKDMYSIVPNGISAARISEKSEMDEVIRGQQSSISSKSSMLTATSTHRNLTVGSVIKVGAVSIKHGEEEIKKHGEFIITSITHTASGNAEYSNTFEALSSSVNYLEAPKVEMPFAQPQIATVLSNEDPEKKGRIQVQFQWQSGDMKTAWIRVMTPDAGAGRGFVFVPEEGDQVMVGFRYNDPNRPFVMGSLFSGSTGTGGDTNNKVKNIITRSGNSIRFDDEAGSIAISDAKNNIITLDGSGNIVVSSSSSILFSAKAIPEKKKGKKSTKLSKKVSSKGESENGSVLSLNSDGTINLIGKIINISGEESVTCVSKEDIVINGEKSATVTSTKIVNISSEKEVIVNGTQKTTVSSSGTTVLQARIVKIN